MKERPKRDPHAPRGPHRHHGIASAFTVQELAELLELYDREELSVTQLHHHIKQTNDGYSASSGALCGFLKANGRKVRERRVLVMDRRRNIELVNVKTGQVLATSTSVREASEKWGPTMNVIWKHLHCTAKLKTAKRWRYVEEKKP